MFAAFHHFRPAMAKAILKDAFDHRRTICIFEAGAGNWFSALLAAILVPINVLLLMPWARPFRWSWMVFTYPIPLLPLILMWDGVVSNLRIYSPGELREMTAELRAADYGWEIGRIPVRGMPGGLPYLIGRPVPI